MEPFEELKERKEIDKLKQELTKTKQALDLAVDALNSGKTLADIAGFKMLVVGLEKALDQIKQITETKDVK